MGLTDIVNGNKKFHKVHIGVDAAIGLIAVLTLVLGDEFFKFFVQTDLLFHLGIAGMALLALSVHVLEHRRHKHEHKE